MADMPRLPNDNILGNPAIPVERWLREIKEILSARVRERQFAFRHTWYLGALTLGTFTIQLITGILLMLYYHPSIPQAHADIKDLQFVVSSGALLRNLHRWSAHAMVFLVFAHMAKVFFRGAYRPPRELNWSVGLGLLQLTVLLSYTGYLLPWDQIAYWGTTVGSNILGSVPLIGDKLRMILLGGNRVNANFLLRFYALHTMVLPLGLILVIAIHIWRLHKDGGMHGVREAESHGDAGPTMSYGQLLFREGIAVQVLATVLILVALRWNAPLEQLADPTHTPNPAKAPWYFTGLQELLHYFPPFVAGVVLPGLVMLGLTVVPYFKVNIKGESLWARNKTRRLLAASGLVVAVAAALIGFKAWVPLVPVLVMGGFVVLAAQFSNRQGPGVRAWLGSRPLPFWIMTWFLMEAVTLTAVGTFFRGPGWSWVWPWRS